MRELWHFQASIFFSKWYILNKWIVQLFKAWDHSSHPKRVISRIPTCTPLIWTRGFSWGKVGLPMQTPTDGRNGWDMKWPISKQPWETNVAAHAVTCTHFWYFTVKYLIGRTRKTDDALLAIRLSQWTDPSEQKLGGVRGQHCTPRSAWGDAKSPRHRCHPNLRWCFHRNATSRFSDETCKLANFEEKYTNFQPKFLPSFPSKSRSLSRVENDIAVYSLSHHRNGWS